MRVIAAASARKDIGYAGRPSSRIGSNNIDSARNTLARMPTESQYRKNTQLSSCKLQRATCLRNVVLRTNLGTRVTIIVSRETALQKNHTWSRLFARMVQRYARCSNPTMRIAQSNQKSVSNVEPQYVRPLRSVSYTFKSNITKAGSRSFKKTCIWWLIVEC